MPDQPNIILIVTDQWRGDCLSIEGHPTVSTPYLDGLAAGGVRFTRAYTATPSCIPARAALLTGLSQASHGRVGYKDGVPWDYPCTIASEFTRHGYQTQAVGKMHVFPERARMGFDNVILHGALGIVRSAGQRGLTPDRVDDYIPWLRENLGSPTATATDHGMDSNAWTARPWDKPEHLHYSNFVADHAIRFMRRRDADKPFFLMASFNAPHPPLDPPRWAFEQYLHRDMPDPPIGDWQDVVEPWMEGRKYNCAAGRIRDDELQRARAGYYGHMTHLDLQINRIIQSLAQLKLGGETYICFTSDHGELMGDHNLYRKAVPYEGSARVPMILQGPDEARLRRGTTADEVVELRDIMPSLLDCAGLPIPEHVEGRSFLPLARGESPTWRDHLHGEHTAHGQSAQWLTDGREKYIWWSGTGREQLFDLVADPTELHDLAPDAEDDPQAADRLAVWRGRLIEHLDGREEGFTDGESLIPGRPVRPCLSHVRPGNT